MENTLGILDNCPKGTAAENLNTAEALDPIRPEKSSLSEKYTYEHQRQISGFSVMTTRNRVVMTEKENCSC